MMRNCKNLWRLQTNIYKYFVSDFFHLNLESSFFKIAVERSFQDREAIFHELSSWINKVISPHFREFMNGNIFFELLKRIQTFSCFALDNHARSLLLKIFWFVFFNCNDVLPWATQTISHRNVARSGTSGTSQPWSATSSSASRDSWHSSGSGVLNASASR